MFWTLLFARLAVLCYLARFPLEAAGKTLAAKLVWTAGAALLAIHVVVAIALVHGGRHSAAIKATAEQTPELFGVEAGYGVWFNYACVAVWIADATMLWLGGAKSLRERDPWFWFVQVFLAFMVFFGAVVFGSVWWLFPIGLSVVATLLLGQRHRALSNDTIER